MFTKRAARNLFASLMLSYICLYVIRLYFAGNLTLYVHPRYTGFILCMSTAALAVLAVDMVMTVRQREKTYDNVAHLQWADSLVALSILLAFTLPATSLSPLTIGERGMIIPSPGQNRKIEKCPSESASSIRGWVFQLSEYPTHCNDDQPIELVGHVLPAMNAPLPNDVFFFGRVVISCCIIDARPYAIPAQWTEKVNYSSETWLHLYGTLKLSTLNGQPQFIINVNALKEIADPAKPYDFLNVPSYITQPER